MRHATESNEGEQLDPRQARFLTYTLHDLSHPWTILLPCPYRDNVLSLARARQTCVAHRRVRIRNERLTHIVGCEIIAWAP